MFLPQNLRYLALGIQSHPAEPSRSEDMVNLQPLLLHITQPFGPHTKAAPSAEGNQAHTIS